MITLKPDDLKRLDDIREKYAPRWFDGSAIYPRQTCPDIWFLRQIITRQQKVIEKCVEQRDEFGVSFYSACGNPEYDPIESNQELQKIMNGEDGE